MTTSKFNFVFKTLVFALAIFIFGEANAQIRTFQGPKAVTINKETVKQLNQSFQSQCLDLKAEKIDFQIVEAKSRHHVRVRVTGVIKNISNQTFSSGANQQSVKLYLDNTYMMYRNFDTLAPGETVEVSCVTDFYMANEFPPTAKVLISWDPDIKNDGNTMNDDCRSSNDSITRSLEDVKSMPFHISSTTVNAPVAPIRR